MSRLNNYNFILDSKGNEESIDLFFITFIWYFESK